MVTRGAAAVALLILPVAVAAAVGFSPSASGLSEGLGSLASGPAEQSTTPDGGDTLGPAITSITVPAGPGATDPASGGTGGPSDAAAPGGEVGGPGIESPPGAGANPPAPGGGNPGAANPPAAGPPGVGGVTDVVPPPVQGGVLEEVLGGVGDTVNGILGGRPQ